MKFFPFLLFFIAIPLFSQEKTYTILEVEKAPVISNCPETVSSKDCFVDALRRHIAIELDVTKFTSSEVTNGKSYVQFTVSPTGSIENVRVRSTDPQYDEEAARVIKELKIKFPATIDGKKVAMTTSIPITFRSVNFDSYDEFFEDKLSEKFNPKVGLKEAAFPPKLQFCGKPKNTIRCINQQLETEIYKSFQAKTIFLKNDDLNAKFYFVIDKNGKIHNPIVNSASKEFRNAVLNAIEKLNFISPAKNEDSEFIPVFYTSEISLPKNTL